MRVIDDVYRAAGLPPRGDLRFRAHRFKPKTPGSNRMASEQFKKVLEIIKSQPANPNATFAQRRAGMERISERVAKDVDCTPVDAGGVSAEWIVPPGVIGDRVILYLHGGGYTMGSINSHRAMIARIARASNARALALDYRLGPEHPFPAAVEDVVTAYRWLLAQHYLPGRIVFAGDSAGGGLTLAALLAIRDMGEPLPAAAVPISPWTDLEGTGDVGDYQGRERSYGGNGVADLVGESVPWRSGRPEPARVAALRRLPRTAADAHPGWRS